MLTLTKIESDSIGEQATKKLVDLTYKRFLQERVGIDDLKLDKKIEEALLYVFALGDWTPDFNFYVEGTQTNCLTQSMIFNIKSKLDVL